MPKRQQEEGYKTVTFPSVQLDEIDKIIERNPELGYSGRPEVFRELLREWFIKMNQYEQNKKVIEQ